jgi:succinate dehydrogenase / fumarate reductase membrane anchor subunit
MKQSGIRSPLGRVRGLGSAHDGTGHFIWQRITAIALVPLSLWFVFSLVHLAAGGGQTQIAQWLSSGLHATALSLMLAALFYHAKLGLQVVIEDYIHSPAIKFTSLLLNLFIMYGFMALSIIAVLKLHLAAPAVTQ